MKAHFIKLLNYDRDTNLLIAETVIKAGSPEKPVQLMAHLLTAQQVWLARCTDWPAPGGALWPDGDADTFAKTIEENSERWIDFINTLTPADFDKVISYKTFRGDAFENRLSDILAHLINHGTHHRAQIGQQLKLAGVEALPITDYIFYIRGLEQNK